MAAKPSDRWQSKTCHGFWCGSSVLCSTHDYQKVDVQSLPKQFYSEARHQCYSPISVQIIGLIPK